MAPWFDASSPVRSRWGAALLSGCVGLFGCGLFGYEELPAAGGPAVAAHCDNGAQDADETNLDCGGSSCAACEVPVCVGADCGSLTCGALPCPAPSCSDSVQDQDETGIDCGGASCGPCPDPSCTGPDCADPTCVEMSCLASNCYDGTQNQDETGIDCGGSNCSPCPTCSDGTRNQDETAVDCGGATCPTCTACFDGIQDQDETGVDCGGATCSACPTCSDGLQNRDETAADCGGSSCAPCGLNTPPIVSFTVTPGLGSNDGTPATTFQADASATVDREDASAALSYAWDWDNDGVTDATGISSSHVYGAAGTFNVRLDVQDSGGLRASASSLVLVISAGNLVRVTTAADENDGGATPASPGGTGLSLREAITFAHGAASRQSILVPAGFAIALTSELPILTAALGMDIIGDGVLLDGSGTGPSDDCLEINGPNNRVFGFEIQNCARSPLRLDLNADGSQFSRLNIHDNPQPVILNGLNVRFGPDNEVGGSASHCLTVVAADATIDRNFFHDCQGRGLDLTGNSDRAFVLGNVITRSEPGALFGNGALDLVFSHNVLHANRSEGLFASTVDTGILLQNNIFSSNAAVGVRGTDSVFAANDHNNYFANGTADCSGCSLGTGSLTVDPRYMDSSADDFRLQPGSPLIDAGVDTGNDVNGADPGNGLFSGSNPDIGAHESN
jgi:PKD repeat protein